MLFFRETILANTHYAISVEGGIQMQVGLLEAMVRFSTLQLNDLADLKAKLSSWDDQLEVESDSIQIEFLDGVIEIFRSHSEDLLTALNPFDNIKPYLL